MLRGSALKTIGGLTKKDFVRKNGKWVNKKASKRMTTNKWALAVQQARKELGITGFCAVKKGSDLYNRAKQIKDGSAPAAAAKPTNRRKSSCVIC